MSAEVRTLPGLEANAELVKMLEGILEEARSGEIRAVAVASVKRSQTVATGYVIGDASIFELIGAIEHVKLRIYLSDVER